MRRGHILALMLVVLASLSASVVVFSGRLSVDLAARQDSALRTQALWLARSALLTDQRGTTTVETAHGPAQVTCDGARAEVTLEGATATITAEPWTERFDRGQ